MSELDPPPRPPAVTPWRERIELLASTTPLTPARIALAVAGVVALLVAGWLLLRTPTGPPTEELLPMATDATVGVGASGSSTTTTAPTAVVAHAAGAVQQPGVYELPAGARVTDVIDAAGGPLPDADLDQLNLAAPVADGERIYVPRVGEVVAAVVGADDAAPAGPLDLNAATLDQLDELPGVGPATAQAIIDERDRRGGFGSVDDLLDVRGIGPAKLEQLRDLVTV
jgi:competence protein ComEA